MAKKTKTDQCLPRIIFINIALTYSAEVKCKCLYTGVKSRMQEYRNEKNKYIYIYTGPLH